MKPDVIIAGAGIGGLACALCLEKHGFTTLILEKSHAPAEAGAGIQLGPNAFHILKHLSLEQELTEQAQFPEKIVMYDAKNGTALTHMPLIPHMQQRHKAPYAVIHRADLHKTLRSRVEKSRRIELKYSSALATFIDAGGSVVVKNVGGEEFSTRVLVGADGLWSTVREQVLGDGPPQYTGQVAWRTVVRRDHVAKMFQAQQTGLWLGQRAHLVHYPISRGQLLNIVAIVEAPTPPSGWSTRGRSDELLPSFKSWAKPAYALLQQVTEWHTWPLYDRNPALVWGRGQVTLLGDAAHPMLPFLAQGGAMAIEDAWVVAALLKDNLGNPETALRAYEALRSPRTGRVSETARSNATMFHLSGRQRLMRNLALKASRTAPGLLLRKYDWLYGYNALNEEPKGFSD